MEKCKFKKNDVVYITPEVIKEKIPMIAHLPRKEFELNKPYIVEDIGKYGDGYNVLVEGSSQFVHEKYFKKYPSMIFKISVEDIDEKDIEEHIHKIREKFKKPLNISSANYMQTIPNSHYWTDLNQLLTSIQYHQQRMTQQPNNNTTYAGEPFTKEYIIIGLNNSIKNGYKLKANTKPTNEISPNAFKNIEHIVEYITSMPDNIQDFSLFFTAIKATIDNGYNLTNGLKLWRFEVYKRIDDERDYQDMRWNINLRENDIPDQEKPPAEWINYMEYHISKAKDEIYHLNKDAALAEIRKVAALAVRAMEIHGCPKREKYVVSIDPATKINSDKTITSTMTGFPENIIITHTDSPSTLTWEYKKEK